MVGKGPHNNEWGVLRITYETRVRSSKRPFFVAANDVCVCVFFLVLRKKQEAAYGTLVAAGLPPPPRFLVGTWGGCLRFEIRVDGSLFVVLVLFYGESTLQKHT